MFDSVNVSVGIGYNILIGSGLLDLCGKHVICEKAGGRSSRAFIITDTNVAPLYLDRCAASIGEYLDTSTFVFPAGEQSKNISAVSDMLEAMAGAGMTRSDIVIALGGGVTGDMAGFAAGCYMRGIRFVQVPTTLLAAVDSSVGGKTAVDLRAGKNMAGMFHQPSLVICATDTLATLPDEEYLCGAAEALKTGVLAGGELFGIFEKNEAKQHINDVIRMCVKYKAGVVERDEREQGERKLLNLGHTVGHAIELLSCYSVKHGMAVAAGLAVITRASAKNGWCSPDTASRIISALEKNGLPVSVKHTAKELSNAAMSDKKRAGRSITIAVPSEIGKCSLKTVALDELEDIIAAGLTD